MCPPHACGGGSSSGGRCSPWKGAPRCGRSASQARRPLHRHDDRTPPRVAAWACQARAGATPSAAAPPPQAPARRSRPQVRVGLLATRPVQTPAAALEAPPWKVWGGGSVQPRDFARERPAAAQRWRVPVATRASPVNQCAAPLSPLSSAARAAVRASTDPSVWLSAIRLGRECPASRRRRSKGQASVKRALHADTCVFALLPLRPTARVLLLLALIHTTRAHQPRVGQGEGRVSPGHTTQARRCGSGLFAVEGQFCVRRHACDAARAPSVTDNQRVPCC